MPNIGGYKYAVIIVDRAEGNGEVGTQWQDTYLVPMDMPLRQAFGQMFGENPFKRPNGRITISVPENLPAGKTTPRPTPSAGGPDHD